MVYRFFWILHEIIILSKNKKFYFFLLVHMPSVFFSCIIALASSSSTMAHRGVDSEHPCLVSLGWGGEGGRGSSVFSTE